MTTEFDVDRVDRESTNPTDFEEYLRQFPAGSTAAWRRTAWRHCVPAQPRTRLRRGRRRPIPPTRSMVIIPTGTFRMGCVSGRPTRSVQLRARSDDCYANERPVHEVAVAFALSKHEVKWMVSTAGSVVDKPHDAESSTPTVRASSEVTMRKQRTPLANLLRVTRQRPWEPPRRVRVRRAGVLALALVALGSSTTAQTFRHVESRNFGRYDSILEVADLNGDGRDDIVVGGRFEAYDNGQPEDRFKKSAMRVLFGTLSGKFEAAPDGFIQGTTIRTRRPVVVAADLNGDRRLDLAIFDYGVYVGEESVGIGNPPQLYLTGEDGLLYRSGGLADAVRRHNRQHPNPEYSGPADLHVKAAAAGDIDNDGDVDLWVQSIGGANVSVHVMVNNGDETFTLDVDRVSERVHYNRPEEHWYFAGVHLADIDNDGDLDVLQGQSRDDHPSTRYQFNIVLFNDGTGHFPSRIELPHARFYRGFTAVGEMTTFDVNGDGWLDILLNHSRNDLSTDAETGVLAFTGRYIQVLINRRVPLPGGGVWFGDETDTWVKGQEATTPQRYPNGEILYNGGAPVMRDLDRDGCADLLMSDTWGPIRKQSPIAYRNNGRGQFLPLPPERFWRDRNDIHFGYGAHVADVNGDGRTDFVLPLHIWGPDGLSDTRDDFTLFTTLLNATPLRAVRCEQSNLRHH